MTDARPRILLVAVPHNFESLHEILEESNYYVIDNASTIKTARFFLRRHPAAVLVHLPWDEREIGERLDWLRAVSHHAPVITLTNRPDGALFLRAMSCGAFDCLSAPSPRAEVLRVLGNAVRWHQHSAA